MWAIRHAYMATAGELMWFPCGLNHCYTLMEAHWVAGELNLRVGSARNGYVLHGLHVGRSLWANLVWTQMVPICFTPTCMVIRKYGTRIGYIIHIWSHMCRYTSITDGVFSFCLYILLSPNFVITLMYSFAESPFRLAFM